MFEGVGKGEVSIGFKGRVVDKCAILVSLPHKREMVCIIMAYKKLRG